MTEEQSPPEPALEQQIALEQSSPEPASAEQVDRAIDFVKNLRDGYVSYHDHKESKAFTGLTLFAGAIGASLVSSAWPPSWGERTFLYAFMLLTALWIGLLLHLNFQLWFRRWAALRVAGCERVLAEWILSPPSKDDLAPEEREPTDIGLGKRLLHRVFPQQGVVQAIEPTTEANPPFYPRALVRAWVARERTDRAVVRNERLIIATGWILYTVAVVATLAAQPAPQLLCSTLAHC